MVKILLYSPDISYFLFSFILFGHSLNEYLLKYILPNDFIVSKKLFNDSSLGSNLIFVFKLLLHLLIFSFISFIILILFSILIQSYIYEFKLLLFHSLSIDFPFSHDDFIFLGNFSPLLIK